MKVVMTRTELGQDTDARGIAMHQIRYISGQQYDVCQSLGEAFISIGAAQPAGGAGVVARAPVKLTRSKNRGAAPENKGV